jgi:putative SOS response-associated peptidase YedK
LPDPTEGFCEWKKTPFFFTMADDRIFSAGTGDSWQSVDGKSVETYLIMITTPNAFLADVHDRIPIILPDGVHDLWLSPGFHKTIGL